VGIVLDGLAHASGCDAAELEATIDAKAACAFGLD
jgi:hypothetical protein